MMKIVIQQQGSSARPSISLSTGSGLGGRRRVPPHNPRTLPQQTQRNMLAAVAAEWRRLTDNERAGWRLMGSQVPGRLSGFDLYVKVNVTLIRSGLPEVKTAPPMPAFGILDCAGLVAEDTPRVKLLQVSSTTPADRLIVWATPPVSQGLENVSKRFRELTTLAGPTPVPADLDLTAVYIARFGKLRAGRRIFVCLFPMSNGFKGQPVQFRAIIARQGAV